MEREEAQPEGPHKEGRTHSQESILDEELGGKETEHAKGSHGASAKPVAVEAADFNTELFRFSARELLVFVSLSDIQQSALSLEEKQERMLAAVGAVTGGLALSWNGQSFSCDSAAPRLRTLLNRYEPYARALAHESKSKAA